MARAIFAECNDKLYINVRYAGMSRYCLILDRVPMYRFGGSEPYLHIDDAIDWHRDEVKATKGKHSSAMLDALIEAKRQFDAEKSESCTAGSA